MLERERVALILQNEEFLSELREDEDFMKTLERGRCCSQPSVDVRERGWVALILQNEEFLSELREDEDFMKTLERGRCRSQPCVDVREREGGWP